MATVTLGALPVAMAAPLGATVAAAAESDPIDPPLYSATAGGEKVRVNVVTDKRTDLPSAAAAGETLQSFNWVPVVTLEVDKDGLDELAAQPAVVSVTEDVPVRPSLDESVPLVGGDTATKAGYTGKGSAIAILDTGVATNHPFLRGRVIAEACFSPIDASYGATSLCPNGTAKQEGTGSANSESGPCATIVECDHGTHVAGIAAGNGKGVNGAPASGVAPGADLIAIQIFSKFDNEDYCGVGATPCVLSFASAQIAALEKVWEFRQAGKPVIAANLSLGGGAHTTACVDDSRRPIIDSLYSAGVATVAAAGNQGQSYVNSPACVPSAIAVGSTTKDDKLSSFTNRGPLVDVLAPGSGIVSSILGGDYASKNGTSMAAPHMAGALAVLRQAYPAESLASLEALIKATGKTITYSNGSTPRIDIGAAVAGVEPDPEPGTSPRPSTIMNDTKYPIPDPGSVQSSITVSGVSGNAPKALQVTVDVTHEWLGEVQIDLVAPNGASYSLKKTNGTDPGGRLVKTYTVDASASPANGTWQLKVEDKSRGGVGTLNGWSMTFPSYESQTTYAIPDPGSVQSSITVSGVSGNAPKALQVTVDVTH
ncbi:S8 family peptidase, partial [Streptomyces nodosus]|uniref:S8 family peptidase n=1 Tax=Streptomyces nodosus TaxID=40318 RepID=UPI00382BDA43